MCLTAEWGRESAAVDIDGLPEGAQLESTRASEPTCLAPVDVLIPHTLWGHPVPGSGADRQGENNSIQDTVLVFMGITAPGLPLGIQLRIGGIPFIWSYEALPVSSQTMPHTHRSVSSAPSERASLLTRARILGIVRGRPAPKKQTAT